MRIKEISKNTYSKCMNKKFRCENHDVPQTITHEEQKHSFENLCVLTSAFIESLSDSVALRYICSMEMDRSLTMNPQSGIYSDICWKKAWAISHLKSGWTNKYPCLHRQIEKIKFLCSFFFGLKRQTKAYLWTAPKSYNP